MKQFFSEDTLGSFIENDFSTKGKKHDHISCITQKPWISFHKTTEDEIDRALKSAVEANRVFRKTTAYERAALLRTTQNLLLKNQEVLAEMIVHEMGKTIKEARAEIVYAAAYFEWFAHEATRVLGYTVPSHVKNKEYIIHHEPIGICAFITPWNFPIAMGARKIAPALAAGCPVLIKPSPEVPCSMLALAQLLKEAGAPEGVFSVLVGDEEMIGEKILEHPKVRKFSFTGSTTVGKLLYSICSKTLKQVGLELGGHAPLLVFDDADLQVAVQESLAAKFRNSGQTCVAATRFLVQEKIYDSYLTELIKGTKTLIVGNPLDEKTDISSILHPQSNEKIQLHTEDAIAKGAETHLSAETPSHPQIFTNCSSNMRIFNEEPFGPIVPIIRFTSDEEGLKIANDTPYGLASYLFTQNLRRAHEAIKALEFGIVSLNDGIFSAAQIPFGGIKESGFGREGGPFGLEEYLIQKCVSQKFS